MIYEQYRLTRNRMFSDHRMQNWQVEIFIVSKLGFALLIIAKKCTERFKIVDRFETGNKVLHPVTQAHIGRSHTGKHCITADLRDD